MPNESTHFPPLGEVVAADPYPWHGLVVLRSGGSGYRLIPHDGRPERDLPVWHGSDSFKGHPYRPANSGILWDIGNDDPPVTPLIEEAGGTAWARRIVSPEASLRLPARIGGVTHQVSLYVQPFFPAVTTVGQLMMEVDGGDPVVAGTFDLADDFGAGLDQLYREGTDQIIDTGNPLTWNCIAMPMDASPDGARRLFGVRLTNTGVSFLADTALVGVFEVFLDADSELGITADIVIRKTAEDCLGVYTQTGTNDLYEEYSEHVEEGDLCWWRYGLRAKDTPGPGHAGTTSRTRQFTGMILGASFIEGEISYHTLDRKIVVTNSCSWDRPDEPCDATQSPPATAVFEGERRWEVKLSINGRQVTAVREYKGGQTHIRQSLSSSPGDQIISRWGEDTLGSFTRTDEVGLANILWPVYDQPAVHARGNYPAGDWGEMFVVSWRRRWSVVATRWGEYWAQGPMIHEYGIEGDWVVTGVAGPLVYGSPPEPINRCAACPITHNAARAVDLPGVTSVAYI